MTCKLDTRGTVYFLEAIGTDTIKIGFSSDFSRSRLPALRTITPLKTRLHFTMDGTWLVEQYIHSVLSRSRVQGEWFKKEDVLRFIESAEFKLLITDGVRIAERHRDNKRAKAPEKNRKNVAEYRRRKKEGAPIARCHPRIKLPRATKPKDPMGKSIKHFVDWCMANIGGNDWETRQYPGLPR